VLGFVDSIPRGPKSDRLVEQLVGAAGSIGGNRAEALGASSYREFIRYNEVSLRGAKESARWLRACAAARIGTLQQAMALLDEARQLAPLLLPFALCPCHLRTTSLTT
jgi:four helix bundle protein